MNLIKRFVRTIRSKMSTGTKKRSHKKKTKSRNQSMHKGGAIYSFDLNDKIGGMPANVALNGTQDGDCPDSNFKDLGFTNYGMNRTSGGGSCIKKNNNKNKHKNRKTSKKSRKHKSKSHKSKK